MALTGAIMLGFIKRSIQYAGAPAIVIFVGALVAGGTALLEWPKGWIFLGSVMSAAGALWASFQRAESAEAMAKLNRYIAGAVMGGDSYCYLDVGAPSNNSPLVIVHKGDYPIYDVSLRIVDLDRFDAVRVPLTMAKMSSAETILPVGTLGVSQAMTLGTSSVPKGDLRWNVFIAARNGLFIQRIRVRKVDGSWRYAMDLVKESGPDGDELLMEQIDPAYPRDEQGNVSW